MELSEEQRKKIIQFNEYCLNNTCQSFSRSYYEIEVPGNKGLTIGSFSVSEYKVAWGRDWWSPFKWISVRGMHNRGISSRRKNKNEERAASVFKELGLNFIPEFPICINDRVKWKEICEEVGVVKEETLEKRTIVLDFYNPIGGFGVEIDSKKFHTSVNQRLSDKARDIYLFRTFDLPVKRIYPSLDFPEGTKLSVSKFILKDIIDNYWNLDKGLEVGKKLSDDVARTTTFYIENSK